MFLFSIVFALCAKTMHLHLGLLGAHDELTSFSPSLLFITFFPLKSTLFDVDYRYPNFILISISQVYPFLSLCFEPISVFLYK